MSGFGVLGGDGNGEAHLSEECRPDGLDFLHARGLDQAGELLGL
jgi:hypothetical protein